MYRLQCAGIQLFAVFSFLPLAIQYYIPLAAFIHIDARYIVQNTSEHYKVCCCYVCPVADLKHNVFRHDYAGSRKDFRIFTEFWKEYSQRIVITC